MGKKRITQSDIAEECGVSLKVVSTILSGRKSRHVRFSEQTRQKVLDTVKKLNYRPNRSAQNLYSNRHNAVGFLVDDLSLVPPLALKYIIQEAKQFGQLVIFEQINWAFDKSAVFFEQDSVDGLIVFESYDSDVFRKIREISVPSLLINTNPAEGFTRIMFDESQCISLGIDFFSSKGRSRPALLLYRKDHYSNKARAQALRSEADRRGMAQPLIIEHPDHFSLTEQLMLAFRNNGPVDCIITDDGMLSLGVEILNRLGLEPGVSADIAAIDNFGGNPDCWTARFPRIRVNMQNLAKEVLSRLNSTINGIAAENITMPYVFLTPVES